MKKSLVFIHGLGLGKWIYDEFFTEHFRACGFDVHVLELPGHTPDSSEAERHRVTLNTCVQYVEEYIAANIQSPFVMVGLSMGGAICQRILAKNYTHAYLRGVILLSSVPPENNLVFTLRLCGKLASSNPQVLIDFFNKKANLYLMFSPEALSTFSDEKKRAYLNKVLSGFSLLEYEIFFQNLVSTPFKTNVPIKIIGGEDDFLFPPEVSRFTASYYSKTAEILPGLGHLIPIEPNHLKGIQAIDAFLKEVLQ